MWSFVFRLALMASAMIVTWNFARAWMATLGAPKRRAELPPESPTEIAARVLAEEATRHETAIQVAIAGLADSGLWEATDAFIASVDRLKAAMLAEPASYKRAKRHLGQILIATEQTAKHFARHYAATPDPGTRRKFMELLAELTAAFDRASARYSEVGAAALEVEAETLKELLRRNRL